MHSERTAGEPVRRVLGAAKRRLEEGPFPVSQRLFSPFLQETNAFGLLVRDVPSVRAEDRDRALRSRPAEPRCSQPFRGGAEPQPYSGGKPKAIRAPAPLAALRCGRGVGAAPASPRGAAHARLEPRAPRTHRSPERGSERGAQLCAAHPRCRRGRQAGGARTKGRRRRRRRRRRGAARAGPSPTDLFLAAAALSLCLRFLNQLPTCVGVSPVA